jgi:hypothetical protein
MSVAGLVFSDIAHEFSASSSTEVFKKNGTLENEGTIFP